MYHDFYRFKENPFNVTADPDFFFSSKCHSDAISCLEYGIDRRKGILVVTGEVGTGKTTLCRKLIASAHRKIQFALILNPNFSELQLLQMIIHDLGIKTLQKNKFGLVQVLNQFLLEQTLEGNNIVVIIDEAQNLSVSQLEQIRLLSNLETAKEKLLQIVLMGQPELNDKLALMRLRQLRQRIGVHYHLEPLALSDIQQYIQHRIDIAATYPKDRKSVFFTQDAVHEIFRFTKGSPRAINLLCDKALLAGFVAETYSIDQDIIESCIEEVLVA